MTATGGRAGLSDDLRAVLPAWMVARVIVLAAWVTSVVAVDALGRDRTIQQQQGLFAWDGAFYRELAERGYHQVPLEALRFFPLYPALGRVLSVFSLGRVGPALVVLANLAALGVGVLALCLVRTETGDQAAARRAAWFVAIFPAGFVLVLAYAEAVFLALVLGAFLALRRQQWWWAAALGAGAGLCRPVGLALVAAAAVEAARGFRATTGPERGARLAAVVAPVVGVGAYLAWVGAQFDDWQAPLRTQDTLRGGFVDPLSRLVDGFRDLAGTERLGDGLHVPFAIVFLVLLVVVGRQLPASYTAYGAAILLLSLSADNLNSLERYGLNAFPIVLALALVTTDERVDRTVLAISTAGLLSLTTLAWLGAYVP